jgi:hypothetical protein
MTGVGSSETRPESRFTWIALATAAIALVRLLTRQATHWEFDEYLFRMGVESFDPLRHHPHPPGYPLLIGLGQLIDAVVRDPFTSLLALAWISSVIGTFAFGSALREITGSDAVAVVGALLFNLSPAMLVHGPEPMSDAPALMFLSLALLAATKLRGEGSGWWMAGFAASCAASIGCRPQYAVAIVPLFLATLVFRGSGRAKLAGLAIFTAVCLAWLVPLIVATGGLERFVEWETGQAAYVAAHDAHLSRGTRSWGEIALRFVAHPWGPKALAIPTLALAAVGAVELVRRRLVAAWPLVVVAAIHLAFTIASSDPADGVRYQLPAQMAVALAAALGIEAVARMTRVRLVVALIPVALLLGYWLYARPVVVPRAVEASPPARAMEWGRANLPKSAFVLWDAPLRAHSEAMLGGFVRMPVEKGLATLYDRPDAELWVFADGATRVPGAQSFSWPYSDAYGKLTRNHYRVVSMIPLPPSRRYLPLRGVEAWERDPDRPEWRWLDQVASLRLPPGGGDLRLRFELPKEVPYASARITVKVDGSRAAELTIARGASAAVVVAVPDGRYADVDIVSSEAFTPAAGTGRDPRRLAVTLTDLVRVPRPGRT